MEESIRHSEFHWPLFRKPICLANTHAPFLSLTLPYSRQQNRKRQAPNHLTANRMSFLLVSSLILGVEITKDI